MNQRLWLPGDPTPDFHARAGDNPRYTFHTIAGRYVVLSFLGSAAQDNSAQVVSHINSRRHLLDDERLCFFGVSIDPSDEAQGRLRDQIPGIRYFWDFDRKVSTLFGATSADPADRTTYQPFTLVLDPMLRVCAHIPLIPAERHNQALDAVLASLPSVADHAGTTLNAPVLILPRVFEPALCKQLIGLYQQHGGSDSGFMREVNGKTVAVIEHGFKRRSDFEFDHRPDLAVLRQAIQQRLVRRLVPEIKRAFQFDVTRMERYIVARYDGDSGGFFRPHKDNTTPGTAHRRFACTINLNAEEYEGGELRFPEFGQRTYRAPTGGAVVFSCSLLHEAMPVTKGERYAFLPFFYDEAAAQLRQANAHSLTGQVFDRAKGENEYTGLIDT
ncbi:redoxin domain-containing protein [Pseudoduganella sp. FT55W]|uniref:Redoxin domain-containing protein n=1 Tax=Duganella rivi TaxID=2666083 RepID=A0A7X4GQF4_9BURK|nr:2OG-Fe(II) oxygenase [Duganella rivi]MYM67280.1 redoxin domain-containing protein [Duganella rivi]